MAFNLKENWFQKSVLILCLALTYGSYALVHHIAQNRSNENFNVLRTQAVEALERRADDISRSLDGVAGLIIATGKITGAHLSDYADALNIDENMQEVDAIGFASLNSAKSAFSKVSFRADIGNDNYGSDQFVVQHVEPQRYSKMLRGLDLSRNPKLVSIAKQARDSGQVLATENLYTSCPTGNHLHSFLLRPVYDTKGKTGALDGPQSGFVGFAFAVINVRNVFERLTAHQDKLISLHVEFEQDKAEVAGLDAVSASRVEDAKYVVRQPITKFGRSMTLVWTSTPAFEASQPFRARWFVLGLGLLITALICSILAVMLKRNRTVTAMVERKSRELDTQNKEKRSILDNAMLAIVSVTAAGKIIHANDASLKLLSPNQPKSAFIGKHLDVFLPGYEITDPDGWTKLNIVSGKSASDVSTVEVEKKTWRTADGATRITLLMRDVTTSERLVQEIAETEQRWNLALTGAEIGVFDVDLHRGTSVVSKLWCDSLDIVPDQGCENPYRLQFDRIHPDDRHIIEAAETACITGAAERAEARFRVRVAQDQWRWIKSDAVVVERAPDGTAKRMLGIQTDITESYKLDQMKHDFVATVSHELRTPLTSIKGSLGLLQAQLKGTVPASSERLVEIGLSNCDRLVGLVNDILDMEKINSGGMTHEAQQEDISQIMLVATEQVESYASQWNVAVEVVTPDISQSIWTDKKRVSQVLTNLLSNACKFAHSGTTVQLSAEVLSDCTKVSVKNFGPGIPEEFKSKIFQPFSQADNSNTRERGGTGLGLNISRHFVEAMGGTIGFESEPDKETVFWFTCPLAA